MFYKFEIFYDLPHIFLYIDYFSNLYLLESQKDYRTFVKKNSEILKPWNIDISFFYIGIL